jgi:hypothetical protein
MDYLGPDYYLFSPLNLSHLPLKSCILPRVSFPLFLHKAADRCLLGRNKRKTQKEGEEGKKKEKRKKKIERKRGKKKGKET